MSYEYTKEMRELDVKLATQLGWTDIKLTLDPDDPEDDEPDYYGELPAWYLEACRPRVPWLDGCVPYFHCDKMTGAGEAAKSVLLHWLALEWQTSYAHIDEFMRQLKGAIPRLAEETMPTAQGHGFTFRGLQLLWLATPAQVATAAMKSFGWED